MALRLHNGQRMLAQPLSLDLRVAVFARDPETLDGLTDYLRAARARTLSKSELILPGRADALVVFGDDFEVGSSEGFIRKWAGAGIDRCTMILVTSCEGLAQCVRSDSRARVLRRPVWGWTLLAAIRSGIRGDEAFSRAHEFCR